MASAMQIDHESSMESFDERRVSQLKAQLVQLERQAVVLTHALSGYKQKLHSAEGAIQQTLNLLLVNLESSTSRGSISLSRSDISSQIKLLEDALQRVSASSAPEESPWVAQAFTPNTTFLKTGHSSTIAEVSAGSLKHLNLIQVTNLEQRLCSLYGDVCAFALRQKQTNNDDDTLCISLQKACEDLQQLSFLVPSVPWATRCCLSEVTVDDLMKALPKLASAKHREVKDLLSAVLKLSEHRYSLLQYRCRRLELDLGQQRGAESKASAHVKSTSASLLTELSTYHESIKEALVTPLEVVLAKFDTLSHSPTDENLKLFLQEVKERAPQLAQVCGAISCHNLSDDVIANSDSSYDKSLRKILKGLKLEKMKLEDSESEVLQAERETRDELKSRLSQLPSNSSSLKIKPFDVSHSKSSKAVAKQPIASSAAASTFLSKYEAVESSLNDSQLEKKSKPVDPVNKQPSWLQEMKDDLSAKASGDSIIEPSHKTVGPKSKGNVKR